MTIATETTLEDLAPFADLGTDPPQVFEHGSAVTLRFYRNGEDTTVILKDDSVVERSSDAERKFASVKSLLASEKFANLGRWADSQRVLLKRQIQSETLKITGIASSGLGEGGDEIVDSILAGGVISGRRNTLVLLDGPAGIGKTSFVRKLAFERATQYRIRRFPLLLHVESRGRVLQNLTDLMAFSLQSLRVNVTYDQIPALVRNGLVTLAIDGFDELGDPNGYDLAWAQLNDLVVSTRGSGSLLLSGRETFISPARIKAALPSVDLAHDTLETFTISPIGPSVAKDWLRKQGWSEEALEAEATAPLFERGSYALRPFFLSQLKSREIAEQIVLGSLDDILSFLVHAMLHREQTKFGRDVEAVTSSAQRTAFLTDLMEEVARDLAENQTDALPGETVSWLAETVSLDIVPEVRGILRNRANVVAFLTEDVRRGYKRFIHEQVYNYFLCEVTISSISNGDLPKYVRRNIFGLDFLENFTDVSRHLDKSQVDKFVYSALSLFQGASMQDRSRPNIAALILAICSVSSPEPPVVIEDVSLDDAFLTETVSPISLHRVTIAQLDARNVDLSQVSFAESYIVALIANDGTILPDSIPDPSVLALPGETITHSDKISKWVGEQFLKRSGIWDDFSVSEVLQRFALFRLLARLARYRPFWLKGGEERAARRILDDPNWPCLKEMLLRHDLLVERFDVPAAGRPSAFYHLRNREALMNLERPPKVVLPMLHDLLNKAAQQQKLDI